jgi:hypothetical protein
VTFGRGAGAGGRPGSDDAPSATLTARQGFGCLALAIVSLLAAVLCLGLGARCMADSDLFSCIGLLTVFPAAFLVVGLVSAAVAMQRFTAAGRGAGSPERPPINLGTVWRPVPVRVRPEPPDVIHLPGASSPAAQDLGRNDGESETT